MTVRIPSICDSCLLRRTETTCDAFPDGIPDDILTAFADHREPVEGDDGITWQFDPEQTEALAEYEFAIG